MCGEKTGIRARAEPEPAAPHACARPVPAQTRSLAAIPAAGATAATLRLGAVPQAAAATSGLQSAGFVTASGLYAATTDVNSLRSGLFLPSELFIPIDPCLPQSLV